MIYAEDLTKKFDDFVAVKDVNFQVSAGRVMVLLGPNGAGKTTTVRMLTSILIPTRGTAKVAGYDVVQQADRVRASVGVLTEQHGLYGRMNAVDYLDFFGRLYGIPSSIRQSRISTLLEQVGLSNDRQKRLGEYSKGMRQKLALIRALLHEPPVLLLDEPTSAMDPESARMVRDAIHSLRTSDRTILLCTHNLSEAEELADQVAILRKGRIILNDTLPNLKQQLLGTVEYEARFVEQIDCNSLRIPDGVKVSTQGDKWIRFRINDPERTNPQLIQVLANQGISMIAFSLVPQTLEQAYLAATNQYNVENGIQPA